MKTKKSKQKPQALCSQLGTVKPHMGMICFWAAKKKQSQKMKFMMREIMYMENPPFLHLLKITPILPM